VFQARHQFVTIGILHHQATADTTAQWQQFISVATDI